MLRGHFGNVRSKPGKNESCPVKLLQICLLRDALQITAKLGVFVAIGMGELFAKLIDSSQLIYFIFFAAVCCLYY